MIAAAIALVLALGFFLVWHFCGPQNDTEAGAKTVTVSVVHGDGSTKEFSIRTDAEFLRQALGELKLVSGDETEYGLFIKTVDGETADDAAQEWWCITKGGEMLNTGVDDTPVKDGDCFELTLKVGYDF